MNAVHLLVVMLPASGAVAMLFVVAFAFSGPRLPGRREFGFFASFTGVWCAAAALEYLTLDFDTRVFFGLCVYIGAALTPVTWLIFACRYTGLDTWLKPWLIAALLLLSAVTIALAFTTMQHGLIWSDVKITYSPIPDLVVQHGWWFRTVHLPVSYLLSVAGLVVLISRFFSDVAAYRSQILGVILSATLVTLINVAYVKGAFSIYGIDPTPVLGSVFVFGLAISLFRGFLGTAPLSYREVFMVSGEGVIMLDEAARIVDINPTGAALSSFAEPVGHFLRDGFPWLPLDESGTRIAGDTAQHNAVLFAMRQVILTGSGGRPVGSAILLRDITLEQREKSALQVLAHHDDLTRVLNRRAFSDAVSDRLRHRPHEWPMAFLFIDLDDFKLINDSRGHRIGDEVLIETATRIEQLLRPGDLLGRLGGDEFAIALDRADERVAESLADRLKDRFADPFSPSDPSVRDIVVGVSSGAAVWPRDGTTLDALLEVADANMYQHKQTKREGE